MFYFKIIILQICKNGMRTNENKGNREREREIERERNRKLKKINMVNREDNRGTFEMLFSYLLQSKSIGK